MLADSTENASGKNKGKRSTGKKTKKTAKKKRKRQRTECSSSDSDSDIDLSVDLKPMDHYVKQRHNMVDEMFSAISSRKLKNMLPAILQSICVDELKQLCEEQLEVMSKKRIRRILAGDDPDEISSSGTEESTSEDEGPITLSDTEEVIETQSHAVDSTSHDHEGQEGGIYETDEMVEEADQIEDGQQGDHVAEHQAEISSWSEGDSSVLLLTPQSSVHSVVSVSDAESSMVSGSEEGEVVEKERLAEFDSEMSGDECDEKTDRNDGKPMEQDAGMIEVEVKRDEEPMSGGTGNETISNVQQECGDVDTTSGAADLQNTTHTNDGEKGTVEIADGICVEEQNTVSVHEEEVTSLPGDEVDKTLVDEDGSTGNQISGMEQSDDISQGQDDGNSEDSIKKKSMSDASSSEPPTASEPVSDDNTIISDDENKKSDTLENNSPEESDCQPANETIDQLNEVVPDEINKETPSETAEKIDAVEEIVFTKDSTEKIDDINMSDESKPAAAPSDNVNIDSKSEHSVDFTEDRKKCTGSEIDQNVPSMESMASEESATSRDRDNEAKNSSEEHEKYEEKQLSENNSVVNSRCGITESHALVSSSSNNGCTPDVQSDADSEDGIEIIINAYDGADGGLLAEEMRMSASPDNRISTKDLPRAVKVNEKKSSHQVVRSDVVSSSNDDEMADVRENERRSSRQSRTVVSSSRTTSSKSTRGSDTRSVISSTKSDDKYVHREHGGRTVLPPSKKDAYPTRTVLPRRRQSQESVGEHSARKVLPPKETEMDKVLTSQSSRTVISSSKTYASSSTSTKVSESSSVTLSTSGSTRTVVSAVGSISQSQSQRQVIAPTEDQPRPKRRIIRRPAAQSGEQTAETTTRIVVAQKDPDTRVAKPSVPPPKRRILVRGKTTAQKPEVETVVQPDVIEEDVSTLLAEAGRIDEDDIEPVERRRVMIRSGSADGAKSTDTSRSVKRKSTGEESQSVKQKTDHGDGDDDVECIGTEGEDLNQMEILELEMRARAIKAMLWKD